MNHTKSSWVTTRCVGLLLISSSKAQKIPIIKRITYLLEKILNGKKNGTKSFNIKTTKCNYLFGISKEKILSSTTPKKVIKT
jgi:hypothetical protein